MNFLDILSGVSLWMILIFVGRLTVKCVDILSGVSKCNISMLCWATRDEFSWYLVGRLAVNDHDISSGPSLWKFFTLVEPLMVDYLKIMSGISRWILSKIFFSDISLWIISIFLRMSEGDFSRNFAWRLTLNIFYILSVTLRWIMQIYSKYTICRVVFDGWLLAYFCQRT